MWKKTFYRKLKLGPKISIGNHAVLKRNNISLRKLAGSLDVKIILKRERIGSIHIREK